MSTKSPFRTDIVKLFSDHILQWVKDGELTALVAAVPLRSTGKIEVRATSEPLIKVKSGRKETQNLTGWPSLGLHAKPNPSLGLVLEGVADLTVGITDSMVKKADSRSTPGVYQARLYSRCILVYPSNVPICDGKKPHWEEENHPQPDNSILWIDFVAEGAVLHTCHAVYGEHLLGECSFILNARLLPLIESIIEEVQIRPSREEVANTSNEIVHSLWSLLFLNIHRSLQEQKSQRDLPVGDIVIDMMSESGLAKRPDTSTSSIAVVQRCCNFIQAHIGQALTVQKIANYAIVSPAQLNRLFRAELNQSVKEYVNNQRLRQAQKLLASTNLPVSFISDNVGFADQAYFSRAFRQKIGQTPGEYRRLHR